MSAPLQFCGRLAALMAVCGALTVQPANGATQVLECPPAIPAASVQLASGPAGWQPYNPARLSLHSAAFMAGAPETKADLKPYSVKDSRGRTVETWKVQPVDGELWLRCGYGADSEVTLSKKVEISGAAECKVEYLKTRDSADIRISCK